MPDTPPPGAEPAARAMIIKPGPAETDPQAHACWARMQERLLSVATPLLFLLLWELAARVGWIQTRFFPAPTQIFASGLTMAKAGTLVADLAASTLRILAGFALGTVTGVLAALALGLSRLVRAALDPFLSALYTVPKLAILPLLLLIFGLGELPSVLLVAMTVFFIVWITCMEAVLAIPENYRETARSFGARGWQMFVHVIWPFILPQLFVSMRIAIGTAVLVIVGVEFVQADVGIGFRIWHSWSLFQADRMYVGVCLVALMGYLFSSIVRWIGRVALPWNRGTRSQGS